MTEHAPKAYGSHVSRVLSAAGFSRARPGRDGYVARGETQSWRSGFTPEQRTGLASVEHVGADAETWLTSYALALETAGLDVTVRPTHVLVARER